MTDSVKDSAKELPPECQKLIEEDERAREDLREKVDHLAERLDALTEILDEFTDRMFLPLEENPLPAVAGGRRLRTNR